MQLSFTAQTKRLIKLAKFKREMAVAYTALSCPEEASRCRKEAEKALSEANKLWDMRYGD